MNVFDKSCLRCGATHRHAGVWCEKCREALAPTADQIKAEKVRRLGRKP